MLLLTNGHMYKFSILINWLRRQGNMFYMTPKEGGLYTCIATNLVDTELKTVMIKADGSFPQDNNGF
ncbi:hypothetical protein DBR06_SOUSAS32410006 [Sousa chinensis]|uniref:Uncharacterized protein n=1 Tax=Sousa chinensis TaxID=103600 RepID=A0A484GR03_SOUCH|nr:hypothetical protein DBR06_SOUSAS32410006 [Sousa chinensis]